MEEMVKYRESLLKEGRIRLVAPTEEDIVRMADAWDSPLIAVGNRMQFLPQGRTRNLETIRKWMSDGGLFFAVQNEAGQTIGGVSSWGMELPDMNATAAIFLLEEHQGKGYGREALRALLRILFIEYRAHRVSLFVYSYNERAIGLYTSMGFVREGVDREALYHGNGYVDVIRMGMLEGEYRALYGGSF